MRADGVGDGGLDRVGMREADDHATGMGGAQLLERSNYPRLHLLEAFPARETEGGRGVLYALPLRQVRQFGERRPGPLPEVTFDQPCVEIYRHPGAGGCGLCGLQCTLQR